MTNATAAGAEGAIPAGPVTGDAAMVAVLLAVTASIGASAWLAARVRGGRPVLHPRSPPPVPWRGTDVAVIAIIFLGLGVAAGSIMGPEASPRTQLLVGVLVQAAALVVGIAMLRGGGASWAALGITRSRAAEDAGIAAVGLAVVLAPLLLLAAALDRIVPYRHSIVTFLQQHREPPDVAVVALAALVVAPLAEEFFFRRVLQGWLERRFPEADGTVAIGLSAAAFAAAHVGHGLAPAPLFLLGLVLGFIALRTGSLTACVLLHAGFNAVGVGLLLAAPPG